MIELRNNDCTVGVNYARTGSLSKFSFFKLSLCICWSDPTSFRYFWLSPWPFLEFKLFCPLNEQCVIVILTYMGLLRVRSHNNSFCTELVKNAEAFNLPEISSKTAILSSWKFSTNSSWILNLTKIFLKKKKICSPCFYWVMQSCRSTCESLEELKKLWNHSPNSLCSQSISCSLKLSLVFLFNN